jgi:hypothetical protein
MFSKYIQCGKHTERSKRKKKACDKGGRIKGFGARGIGFGNNAIEAARTTFGNRGLYKPSTNKDDNKKDNSQSQGRSTAPEPPQQTHSESS